MTEQTADGNRLPEEPQATPVRRPTLDRLRSLTGRQRILVLGGFGLLVLALVAGVLAVTGNRGPDQAGATGKQDLRPFRQAVDDLAGAQGLRYQDTSAFGVTENEITVTAGGSQFGTTSSGRNDSGQDVLRIGGRTFMRWQVDPAPRKEVAAGEKAPPSQWIVGLDDGSTLMDEALARTVAPSKLAAVLVKALDDLEKNPQPANESKASSTSGQQPPSVNGTPALGIDTSAGRLLVTKAKPHRVLRLEAYDVLEDLSDVRDRLENGEVPAAPRRVTTGPLASGDGEGMDLTPIVTDAAVDKMFDTLVEYAEQLKDATDRGITFTLDGAGEMDCGSSGCTAAQRFTGEVSSIAWKERVTQGEVIAVLSATFSIEGKPAGQCTSPQRTFPVRGNRVSGTLECSNPGAGPLYSSVAARIKAQAEAQAQACGCRVRLTYPLRANTWIDARALAKVEVQKLIDRAKRERGTADCLTSSPPRGSTRTSPTVSRAITNRSHSASASRSSAWRISTRCRAARSRSSSNPITDGIRAPPPKRQHAAPSLPPKRHPCT
ncbi:hypothetical protein [Streptomyces macrosporus]|uniref:Peptidoglycan binding domain-containing protein n=1 Tax=Streptomyces macrosporus TaxID=44032 RepID=A0ABN3JWC3_9ACTN